MESLQIAKLVTVLFLGSLVLIRYYIFRNEINTTWNTMKSKTVSFLGSEWRVSSVWVALAVVGVASTLTSLIIEIFFVDSITAYSMIGIVVYFFGAIAWPSTIGAWSEPYSLAVTAFGSVLWATAADTSMWIPYAISAAYHVCVDMCWYYEIIYNKSGSILSQFAAWSGFLAMLHYAFASFVTAEDIKTENTFMPDLRLTYSQWERAENVDSCSKATCVVHPVSTNYGSIDIGYAVAAFSWISGTNHLITYLGLFSDNAFVKKQVGLSEGAPHLGNAIRTADWAISASLMMATNLFLFESPGNITSLAALTATTALIMVVGWVSEVFHALDFAFSKWIIYGSGAAAFLLSWLPLLTILNIIFDVNINRKPEGCFTLLPPRSPPLEVRFFIGWLFGSFLVFPIVHFLKLWYDKAKAFKFEIWFAILSFVSKLPLLAVFYGGILARRNTIESDKIQNVTLSFLNVTGAITEPPSEPTDVYIAIGVGTSIAVVSAVAMVIAFRTTLFSSSGMSPTAMFFW